MQTQIRRKIVEAVGRIFFLIVMIVYLKYLEFVKYGDAC